jgi:hypothetical protein
VSAGRSVVEASASEWLRVWSVIVVGTLLAVASIAAGFDAANFDNDAAQHVSGARNLLDGRGLSTSLLFYDEHYLQQRLPAAQTVWPPGHSLLLAALLAVGVPAAPALLFLGTAGHALGGLLLYRLGRVAGLNAWLAMLCSLAWLGCTTELGLIVRGYTEPLFTAATLAAAWAFAKSLVVDDRRRRYALLVGAGVAAGAAFLLRYAGIAFIGAFVSTTFVVALLLERRALYALRAAMCVAAPPILVIGAVFTRNWSITSTLTGWPQVDNEADIVGALRAFYWAIQDLVGGADGGSDYTGYAIQLTLVVGVLALLAILATRSPVRSLSALGPAAGGSLALALLYAGATSTMLVVLAASRYPELLGWRYLVPVVPFVLLAVAILCEAAWRTVRQSSQARAAAVAAVALWFAAVAVGQARTTDLVLTNTFLADRARALTGALEYRVGDRSLREILERDVSLASPLLSNEGQGLGGLVERPALSLSPRAYANMIWDEPTVRALVEQYCVRWVVFFPSLFDEHRLTNSNRAFFVSLARRTPPDWLEAVGSSEHVDVYRSTLECSGLTPSVAVVRRAPQASAGRSN